MAQARTPDSGIPLAAGRGSKSLSSDKKLEGGTSSKKLRPQSVPSLSSASSSDFTIPHFAVQRLRLDGLGAPFPVAEKILEERQQTTNVVDLCLSKECADSTIKTYESLIAQEVGQAEQALDTLLLPLDTEDKFLALFGWILKNNADIKWSRVRSLRSALIKYHARRGQPSILTEWSPKMTALWAGLSKSAKHDSKGKDPIDIGDVLRFFHRTATDTEPAMQRNRAMIAVSFFGVRRSAETRTFVMADVKRVANHDFTSLSNVKRMIKKGWAWFASFLTFKLSGPTFQPGSSRNGWKSGRFSNNRIVMRSHCLSQLRANPPQSEALCRQIHLGR